MVTFVVITSSFKWIMVTQNQIMEEILPSQQCLLPRLTKLVHGPHPTTPVLTMVYYSSANCSDIGSSEAASSPMWYT